MTPYASFHMGIHCLPKKLFTSIQNERDNPFKGVPFSFGYCNLITTPLLCNLTKVLNIGIHIKYRPVESGKIVSSIYQRYRRADI